MPRVASMLAYMLTGYDGESITARSSRVVVGVVSVELRVCGS